MALFLNFFALQWWGQAQGYFFISRLHFREVRKHKEGERAWN
jgi:hypothetical protein